MTDSEYPVRKGWQDTHSGALGLSQRSRADQSTFLQTWALFRYVGRSSRSPCVNARFCERQPGDDKATVRVYIAMAQAAVVYVWSPQSGMPHDGLAVPYDGARSLLDSARRNNVGLPSKPRDSSLDSDTG